MSNAAGEFLLLECVSVCVCCWCCLCSFSSSSLKEDELVCRRPAAIGEMKIVSTQRDASMRIVLLLLSRRCLILRSLEVCDYFSFSRAMETNAIGKN